MLIELVMIVSRWNLWRLRAISSVVVPESSRIVSFSSISVAATRPIACFSRVLKNRLLWIGRVLLALGLGVGEADRSAAGPNQQIPFVECVEVFADRNFRYAEFPVEFFDRDRRLAFQSLQNH